MTELNGKLDCRAGYVYQFKDKVGRVIYVGKTGDIDKRMQEHFGSNGHLPREVYEAVDSIEYMALPTYADAGIAERYLIGKLMPEANTQFTDEGFVTLHVDFYPHSWMVYGDHPVVSASRREVCDIVVANAVNRNECVVKPVDGPLKGYRMWLDGDMAALAAGDYTTAETVFDSSLCYRGVWRGTTSDCQLMIASLYNDYLAFCKENCIKKKYATQERFAKQLLSDVKWLAKAVDDAPYLPDNLVLQFAVDVLPHVSLNVLPAELVHGVYKRWLRESGWGGDVEFYLGDFWSVFSGYVSENSIEFGFRCEELLKSEVIPRSEFNIIEPLFTKYHLSDWDDLPHSFKANDGDYEPRLRQDRNPAYVYSKFLVRLGCDFGITTVTENDGA